MAKDSLILWQIRGNIPEIREEEDRENLPEMECAESGGNDTNTQKGDATKKRQFPQIAVGTLSPLLLHPLSADVLHPNRRQIFTIFPLLFFALKRASLHPIFGGGKFTTLFEQNNW
jgi:hypothetical protein